MKFYSFTDIRAAGDCAALATSLYGCVVKGGRCAALWRGGDNAEAVSIDRTQWYDHVEKRGGGILELAAFHFAGNTQQAQEYLGALYGLTPRMETGAQPEGDCRHAKLLRDGYVERARYEYRDTAGDVRHVTIRMQHPDRPGKEFVQGHPDGRGGMRWTLKGVDTVLYRLPEIAAEPWALICEGEKSAYRMAALGLPSTTAPMGAGKWRDAYTDALAGKHVAIAPDNDEPGREHAETVARALHGRAASVRIVGPLSARDKGGIDDWLDEAPGRDADAVLAAIAAATEWAPPAIAGSGPTDAMLREAKAANAIPFRNYVPRETETEKRGRKGKDVVKEPRTHAAMLDDLSRRFLGFPRKVGDAWLFDHDRDSGRIVEIHGADTLISWISRRSKSNADFARGDGFATPRELLESIKAQAYRYESISDTPDYPRRDDVYYQHGEIPAPDPRHARFERFVDFFLPASPEDRCLISALVCAPLWYIPGIDRPSWVIDSRDGQGSGKTNLAELVADLYGHAPVSTSKLELSQRFDVLIKRLVSQSGRRARILLVDNVTGDFQSPELADLITRKDITGIPPYGHGEEVRQNNLTVIVTANTATVGSDIADRSLYIHVRKPEATNDRAQWKATVQAYIRRHRLEIVADIIDMLARHKPFDAPPVTRFAAWETAVLQPCCGTPEAYQDVLEHLRGSREESNVEADQARAIVEHFTAQIQRAVRSEIPRPVFIRSDLVNSWGRQAINDATGTEHKGLPIQLIRNLAKAGFLPMVDRDMKRWPPGSSHARVAGIAWGFDETTEQATVISKDAEGGIKTTVMP
jgi:hypothetical protein